MHARRIADATASASLRKKELGDISMTDAKSATLLVLPGARWVGLALIAAPLPRPLPRPSLSGCPALAKWRWHALRTLGERRQPRKWGSELGCRAAATAAL